MWPAYGKKCTQTKTNIITVTNIHQKDHNEKARTKHIKAPFCVSNIGFKLKNHVIK